MVTQSDEIYVHVNGKRKLAEAEILDQILKDRAEAEARQAEADAKAAARKSALAKLADLGLTAEEIAAL